MIFLSLSRQMSGQSLGETHSGLCPVDGFGSSRVEPSGSAGLMFSAVLMLVLIPKLLNNPE
jgi:hypothetical protein